jgi:hypothetical protein
VNDKRASDEPPAGTPTDSGYWFTPMPIYLLEATFDPASPVNGSAAMLWAYLHRHYAWRKRVFPSYATLGRETDQSESAVKRQLKALKEVGALNWGANYGPKGRSSNEYALAPHRPFEFDRGTAPSVEVRNDLHRPVEARNDPGVKVISDPNPQVKNDLGVKSTVELETTTSAPTDPPATSGTEGGGGGDQQQEAETFLQSLPSPWAAGPVDARKLAPLLLERTKEQGWDLDAALAAELTKNPGGVERFASVLPHRIANLIKRPTAKTRASPRMPDWCGDKKCDPDTRTRDTTDADGYDIAVPCHCYPDHQEAA